MNSPTSTHSELIESFYRAFQKKDFDAMAQCYHPDVYFKDEAFELKGKQVAAMWHMLCLRGKDMTLQYHVSENKGKISAHWEPKYSFSQTGRVVHNIIDSEFEFKDGKIIKHIDRFNFWHWSRQALGAIGFALGWSPFLQKKVSAMAMQNLNAFIKQHPQYQC